MSTLSIDDIHKLARLSAINLNDEAASSMLKQLKRILSYVEQLDEVDTDGVRPTYQVGGLENVMRDDEVKIDIGHDALLSNTPAVQDGCVKVNKVL